MSTKNNNLSGFDNLENGVAVGLKVGIVKAHWNSEVTDSLLKGAKDTLTKYGAKFSVVEVPGTVELTYGAKQMLQTGFFDAVIVLGCVIQGETRHFDFVCSSVTQGVTELNLIYDIPVIFGVLTTENQQQAIDRSGGKYGNKGVECAVAAVKMAKIVIDEPK